MQETNVLVRVHSHVFLIAPTVHDEAAYPFAMKTTLLYIMYFEVDTKLCHVLVLDYNTCTNQKRIRAGMSVRRLPLGPLDHGIAHVVLRESCAGLHDLC